MFRTIAMNKMFTKFMPSLKNWTILMMYYGLILNIQMGKDILHGMLNYFLPLKLCNRN